MVQWTNQWQILENMGQVIALKELYCPKVFTSTISRLENLGHATSTMVPILLRSSTCYQNGHQKKSMETALAWAQNARSTQIPLFSTDPKIFTRSSRGAYSPRISQNRPTACPSGRLWRFLVQNASKKSASLLEPAARPSRDLARHARPARSPSFPMEYQFL